MEEFTEAFAAARIKGNLLPFLTDDMLQESLHIEMAMHRKQILLAIQELFARAAARKGAT